jgi:glycosyltransferase involved in cell wall biosynthesis
MGGKPLISVVTVFLNAEKFIEEAIVSVLVQTYDNWELLLVDDGSSDASSRIALRYAEHFPVQVCYLEHSDHQNRGTCASRNLGIGKAKGDYIALLDADDVWFPHKLERQMAILDSNPEAALVYGAPQYWYSWSGDPRDKERDYVTRLGVQQNTLFKPPTLLTLTYPLGKANSPCPSDLLLRREIIERIGGFEEAFDGIYQLYEDQAFLAKLYLKAPVYVSSECWDKYRNHPNSCVSVVTKAGQYHLVRLFFLNWLQAYLSKEGLKDVEIWKALRKALWQYRHPIMYRFHPKHLIKLMKDLLKLILPVRIIRSLQFKANQEYFRQ